jgi:hypothetical protein
MIGFFACAEILVTKKENVSTATPKKIFLIFKIVFTVQPFIKKVKCIKETGEFDQCLKFYFFGLGIDKIVYII